MYDVISTETQVYIAVTNGDFDVERRGVARNPKMNVDQVVMRFCDGDLTQISLKGKAYKGDGTLGNSLASQPVHEDQSVEDHPDDSYLAWDTLPSSLQQVFLAQIAKHSG